MARLVPLRQWFAWLARTHRVLLNPASDLDLPGCRWQPRSGMTVGEVEEVIAQPDLDAVTGLRDRTSLEERPSWSPIDTTGPTLTPSTAGMLRLHAMLASLGEDLED